MPLDAFSPRKGPRKIVAVGGGNGRALDIVLVPVGYPSDSVDVKMKGFVELLREGFASVGNLSFSYAYPSAQLQFTHVGRLALIGNYKSIFELEKSLDKKKVNFRAIIFVLNTGEYVGSGGNWPIVAGSNEYAYYLLLHELGHRFGLNDGYETYYDSKNINGSELFTSIDALPKRVKNAYSAVKPGIEDTGNFCGAEKVYRFAAGGGPNIMSGKHFEFGGQLGSSPIFSPMQIWIMNDFVKYEIKRSGR